MEHQTFADGIGRIAIIDGIVRLDLIAHSPTETGTDGKPRAVFSHRIVMGMDQFLRAADKIAETRQIILNAKAGAPPAHVQTAQAPIQHAQPAQAQYTQAQPQQPQRPGGQPQQVPPQFRRESVHPDRPAAAAAPQRPFP